MMNSSRFLMTLLLAGASLGAAQAAAPDAAHATSPAAAASAPRAMQAKHRAAAHHRHHAAYRHHAARKPAPRISAMDRTHEQVARLREAEQRRWISAETRRGRLDGAQAASLREAAEELERATLSRRGHETVDQALAISHREDLLDWVIRSGELQFEPQVLRRTG